MEREGREEMGSFGEECVFQMDEGFIESDGVKPNTTSSSSDAFSVHVLQGILSSATEVEMEVLDKAMKYAEAMEDEGKKSSMKKTLMMRLRNDGYNASLCISSSAATRKCPKVYYEYIDIVVAEKNGVSTRLIVDTDFRSQFEVARATSAHKQLLNTLPCIFVGTEDKFKKVFFLLCSSAKQSLKESGLDISPWRNTDYMLSKWLPRHNKASAITSPNPTGLLREKGEHSSTQINDAGDGSRGGLSSEFSHVDI